MAGGAVSLRSRSRVMCRKLCETVEGAPEGAPEEKSQ
jgi:hypothetical protein